MIAAFSVIGLILPKTNSFKRQAQPQVGGIDRLSKVGFCAGMPLGSGITTAGTGGEGRKMKTRPGLAKSKAVPIKGDLSNLDQTGKILTASDRHRNRFTTFL